MSVLLVRHASAGDPSKWHRDDRRFAKGSIWVLDEAGEPARYLRPRA